MGNPVFRFTLTHASFGSMVISEPDGWKDAQLKAEEDKNFNSLIDFFESGFIFYGENNVDNGGADFIRQVENLYGFNAIIEILVEADIDGDGVFEETVFNGQLDITQIEEVPDNKIKIPIIKDDLWTKFISRKDTPVSLFGTSDLDGNTVTQIEFIDLNLPTQKIRKIYQSTMENSVAYGAVNTSQYIQIDWDRVVFSELDEKYALKRSMNPVIPQAIFIAKEGGVYNVDIKLYFTRAQVAGDGSIPNPFVFSWENLVSWLNVYIKRNNGPGLGFTRTDFGAGTKYSSFTYSGTFNLNEGDTITIYGDPLNTFDAAATNPGSELVLIGSDPSGASDNFWNGAFTISGLESYLNITADTTYRQTSAQSYLIHDAFASIVQKITGVNCFYSEFFGSTSTNARTYPTNGRGWRNVLAQGLQLREYQLTEKQFSISFMDCWKGADSLFCLGLAQETLSTGERVIRIEPREYFKNASSISVNFSNVRKITREYDDSKIYNRIEVGFQKWQSEDISGLDDIQTKGFYSNLLTHPGNSLSIVTTFICASIAIEVTRRQTREQSKDYKYDNEVFLIAINGDDISPDRYTPELDENFNSITGLLNSNTRYNSIHTPLRMLLRWGKVWNGCLQKYQSSSLKFVSREGNYNVSTDYSCGTGPDQYLAVICDNLSEKQDIPLGAPSNYGALLRPIYWSMLYTIEVINFTWDEWRTILENKSKAIGISITSSNHVRFFIKELVYEVCKGKCRIVAWPYDEAAANLMTYYNTTYIQEGLGSAMPERNYFGSGCYEDDLRLTEDGSIRITEDGECRRLESEVVYYLAEFANSALNGWTSEGADIPAPTLEALSGWDNAGLLTSFPWTLGAIPEVTVTTVVDPPDESDFIRGEIITVVGLTYQFSYQIEITGVGSTNAHFQFALLDSSNNILDIGSSPVYTSIGVKTGTITLSPAVNNGAYFAIWVFNNTAFRTKTYYLQASSLVGGTGSVSVALPSWAYNGILGGSAMVTTQYENYGVKNFVLDNTSLPQTSHTIEIKYAATVNNSDVSLRLKIKDSGGVVLHNAIFASSIGTGEQTATINITSSAVWLTAYKFEILAESGDFDRNDVFAITQFRVYY